MREAEKKISVRRVKSTGVAVTLAVVFLHIFIFLPHADGALPERIRISYRQEAWTMVYIAGRFAEKYGLEVEPVSFKTGVETMEALLAGSLQFADMGDVPAVTLLTRSKDFRVVALSTRQDGRQYRLVVHPKSNIRTFADLKGKRIATRIGSGSYVVLSRYAQSQGMKIGDFQILNSTPPEIIAAMEAGSVDAGLWIEPTPSIILAKGLGRPLMAFQGMVQTPAMWVASKKFLDEKSEVMVRFLASFMDAQDVLENYKEAAAILISKGFAERGQRLEPSVFRVSLDRSFNPRLSDGYLLSVLRSKWQELKERKRMKGAEPDWPALLDEKHLLRAMGLRRKTSPDVSWAKP